MVVYRAEGGPRYERGRCGQLGSNAFRAAAEDVSCSHCPVQSLTQEQHEIDETLRPSG